MMILDSGLLFGPLCTCIDSVVGENQTWDLLITNQHCDHYIRYPVT